MAMSVEKCFDIAGSKSVPDMSEIIYTLMWLSAWEDIIVLMSSVGYGLKSRLSLSLLTHSHTHRF